MTDAPRDESRVAVAPRVCLLAGSFHPVVGGGERHARLLCRELARRGVPVQVLTRRRTRDLPRRESMDGFAVNRVGPSGFARLGKYFMLFPALVWLYRRRADYDLVYVCGLRVLGWAGMAAQILFGKPCVLRAEARGEFSGEFIWKTPEGRIRPLPRRVFRPFIALRNRLYRKAAGFLSISTPIRDEFLAEGVPSSRIADVPNGLDVDVFRPEPAIDRPALRARLSLPPDAAIFAYSGKLNRGKGLERLLRAWSRFAPDHPRAHLVLVGSGQGQSLSCEEDLRRFVRERRLESSVTFTGYVENVQDHLHAADVFAFPSESEAQGLAVLEAMACRRPVLASRIPGVMDMVEDGVNGRLVDPRDDEAWRQAFAEFLESPDVFRRLAEAGCRTAHERYGMAAVAENHLAFFRRIL